MTLKLKSAALAIACGWLAASPAPARETPAGEAPARPPRPVSAFAPVPDGVYPYRLPPGVAFADRGEHVADGVVARGAVLASAPLTFRRTGVLAEDVTGFSIWVKGVLAPKGSPAIYLGPAAISFGGETTGRGEFWCFLPARAGGSRDSLCLAVFPRMSAIGPDKANPYLFSGFAPSSGTPNWANNPVITEGPVELGAIRMEYRLGGWSRRFVTVDIYAGGAKAASWTLQRGSDGSARLYTPSGVLRLKPDPDGARSVTVGAEP